MEKIIRNLLLASAGLTCSLLTFATPDPEGLKAEGEKRWEDALKIYDASLAKDPKQLDVWVRVSDIQNQLEHPLDAADALNHAIQLNPNDANLYYKLSQSYAVGNKPEEALQAINKAVELVPNNAEYLKSQRVITIWNTNNATAAAASPPSNEPKKKEPGAPVSLLDQGSVAEGEKNWNEALKIYDLYLKEHPSDATVWLKVTDIQSILKRPLDAAYSFSKAAKIKNDSALYFQASQAYSMANQPQNAMDSIDLALKIDPKNLDYLNQKSAISGLMGNEPLALKTYQDILAIDPNNQAAQRGIIQLYVQDNKLDLAASLYGPYLEKFPNDESMWIDYVKVSSWRGDFLQSLKTLEQYRKCFGATKVYLAEKARVLASNNWGNTSLAIVKPLLRQDPNNYEYLYTRTLAEYISNQILPSFADLRGLDESHPNNPDIAELSRDMLTPYRSNVTASSGYWPSTDTIRIYREYLNGQYFLNPLTSILVSTKYEYLTAGLNSGYQNIDGSDHADSTSYSLGFQHRFSPEFNFTLQVGQEWNSNSGNMLIYNILADFRINDQVKLLVQQYRDIYDISPRSVSLGIKEDRSHLHLFWEPSVEKYLDMDFVYSHLSDTTSEWQGTFWPSMGIARTQYVNLNIGAKGYWQSYSKDLNDGYYAPSLYQQYYLTLDAYIKQNENIAYSISTGVGPQKDNSTDNFSPGADVTASGFFGINSDWYLVASTGWSHSSQTTSEYNGYFANLALTRRF